MGNVQCGPRVFEHDEGSNDFVFVKKPSTTSSARNFGINVHHQCRADEYMLARSEVSRALLEQTIELVKRYHRRQQYSHVGEHDDDTSSTVCSHESIYEYEDTAVSSSVMESNFTAMNTSTLTTVSAATEQIGNNSQRSSYKKRQHLSSPSVSRSNESFTEAERLKAHIREVLYDASIRRKLGNLELVASSGCQMDLRALSRYDPEYSQLVVGYLSVLHLKFVPRCARYFQTNLSNQYPDNAVTMAVTSSITSTDLSPPRKQRHQLQPNAGSPRLAPILSEDSTSTHTTQLSISSTSSSSSGTEVDFGVSVTTPIKPVQMLVTNETFLDLALTGSLGLVPGPTAKQPPIGETRKNPDQYLVILNRRSGIPLAVCSLRQDGASIVRVFSTQPRAHQQIPAATTYNLGLTQDKAASLPLYTWAEFVAEGQSPGRVVYSVYMALGGGLFEEYPSYTAVHESLAAPTISIMSSAGRCCCAVLSMLCTHQDAAIEEEDIFFRLSVAKGVDPALFLCLAGFIDEALEKVMRLQTSNIQERIYRLV